MTTQTRKPNPMKQLAMQLAHFMDDQKDITEKSPWEREEIRHTHKCITNEILQRGYDIDIILYLAEEYKTLSVIDYLEWKYI